MGLVVSFAGKIGSGKSSVTRALANALSWRRAAFGDYLRAELARRGGDPESREDLQNLGQSLVESDPEMFCQAVLEAAGFRPGDDLLVDGIRHTDIHNIIRRLVAPSQVRLLYLAVDEATQIERVSTRLKGKEDFPRAEQHRVESELKGALPSMADAVLDAQEDLDMLVERCRSLIDAWRETKPE